MVIYVFEPTGASVVQDRFKRRLEPLFEFKYDPEQNAAAFEAIDRFLYPEDWRWDFPKILLGSNNHEIYINPDLEISLMRWASHLMRVFDAKQEEAFCQMLRSIFSIVAGPAGSGKSMLVSTYCATCLKNDKDVLVLCKTEAEVHELHKLAVAKAKEVGLAKDVIAGMVDFESLFLEDQQELERLTDAESKENLNGKLMGPSKLFTPRGGRKLKSMMHTATAVFTTPHCLADSYAAEFDPDVLICDNAERFHDLDIFTPFGIYWNLEKIVLIGNDYGPTSLVGTGDRNHLRRQLALSTMVRLIKTGIPTIRLDTQYNMDPDISEFPRQHGYAFPTQDEDERKHLAPIPLPLLDSPLARNPLLHNTFIRWVSEYLQKPSSGCKASLFVHVKDGKCLRYKQSNGKVNCQNFIAMLQILRSLPAAELKKSKPLIITFYRRSVEVIRTFFESQNTTVRVEHIDSETLKPEQVVFIDFPTPFIGDEIGLDARRIMKALMQAKGLRIVVGHDQLGMPRNTIEEMSVSVVDDLCMELVKWHQGVGMVKEVLVGREVLDFERTLCPENYVVDGTEYESSELFRDIY